MFVWPRLFHRHKQVKSILFHIYQCLFCVSTSGRTVFFYQNFIVAIPLPTYLQSFDEKSVVIHLFVNFFYRECVHFPYGFRDFLFVLVSSLNTICIDFVFVFGCVCIFYTIWCSLIWICGLVSVTNFGKFTFFNYSSAFVSFFIYTMFHLLILTDNC